MYLQIGVYDFFSYTIPGTFYLAAGIYIHNLLSTSEETLIRLSNLPNTCPQIIIWAAIYIIVSYMLGLLMDSIANKSWLKLFERSDFEKRIESNYKIFDNLTIEEEFDKKQAYLLYSLIKKTNREAKIDTEKYKAISIMLRNISFALIIFALIQFTQLFCVGLNAQLIASFVLLVFFSIIAARQSVDFNIWFFSSIYQTVITETCKPKYVFPIKKEKNNHENPAQK